MLQTKFTFYNAVMCLMSTRSFQHDQVKLAHSNASGVLMIITGNDLCGVIMHATATLYQLAQLFNYINITKWIWLKWGGYDFLNHLRDTCIVNKNARAIHQQSCASKDCRQINVNLPRYGRKSSTCRPWNLFNTNKMQHIQIQTTDYQTC